MEQVINRYQSPYRMNARKMEVDNKAFKYWGKFVKQSIISAGILIIGISCKNISFISNSAVWNKVVAIAKSDLTVEQIKSGIEWGVEYARVSGPELLGIENKESVKVDNVDVGSEILATEIEQEPEVDPTYGMTQNEKDIYNILRATTILRPLNGEITSPFGDRIDPITNKYSLHTGTDFGAVVGTQIKSAITGTVTEVKKSNVSFGNYVRVKNADIVTTYAHCSTIKVAEGDKVSQGDVIALSGNTGKSSGPHLHFEITKDGRYVDPEKVIYLSPESV